jgi:hypothetical protein
LKGAEVARTDTSDAGKFLMRVPAGEYVVQGQNLTGGPLPSATPTTVKVHDGALTTITINFDSGVRGPTTR